MHVFVQLVVAKYMLKWSFIYIHYFVNKRTNSCYICTPFVWNY